MISAILIGMVKLKPTEKDYATLSVMLRQVDFFASMTLGQLEVVLPFILLYSCEKGETVFKQGDQGDAFYIVYEGAVRVKMKKGLFSFSKAVSTLGPGNFFGEMALLSKQPRTATIEAVESTKLFVLTSVDFEYICKQNPAFAVEMDRVAQRRKFSSAH